MLTLFLILHVFSFSNKLNTSEKCFEYFSNCLIKFPHLPAMGLFRSLPRTLTIFIIFVIFLYYDTFYNFWDYLVVVRGPSCFSSVFWSANIHVSKCKIHSFRSLKVVRLNQYSKLPSAQIPKPLKAGTHNTLIITLGLWFLYISET